ncbi:MAG: hypothetical protein RL281_1666, partial [Pseudomonadota bacterium]
MEIVLITGMSGSGKSVASGSGKSVALHALEDAGFYCVDNLPPELLIPFAELERDQKEERVAIAIDVRSAASLPLMPGQLEVLRNLGDVGFWGLLVDQAYGGAGVSFTEFARFLTKLAQLDPTIAGLASVHGCIGAVDPLQTFGNTEQQQRF